MTIQPGPRWPEHAQAAARALDDVLRSVAYGSSIGAELADWGLGWAVATGTADDRHANLVGTTHGGFVTGLADLAFEVACNSYGRVAVAVQLDAHFAAAAPLGAPLRAEAVEVSRSRRVASYRVDVTTDGALVAWCQAVAYRTSRWHVDEAVLPPQWQAAH
jgi:acyl-CoA thioesterase